VDNKAYITCSADHFACISSSHKLLIVLPIVNVERYFNALMKESKTEIYALKGADLELLLLYNNINT